MRACACAGACGKRLSQREIIPDEINSIFARTFLVLHCSQTHPYTRPLLQTAERIARRGGYDEEDDDNYITTETMLEEVLEVKESIVHSM